MSRFGMMLPARFVAIIAATVVAAVVWVARACAVLQVEVAAWRIPSVMLTALAISTC